MFSGSYLELVADGVELLSSLGVVGGAGEIHPVAFEGVATDLAAGRQQAMDQAGEVEAFAGLDVAQHLGLEHADAHEGHVGDAGVLGVRGDALAAVEAHHLEVDGRLARVDGQRGQRAGFAVVAQQGREIERGEHVAVDDEEAAFDALDLGQAAGRTERMRFDAVAEPQAIALAGAEAGADQVGERPDGQHGLAHAGLDQPRQQQLEHGAIADGQHGPGEQGAVAVGLDAAAVGEDDGFHGMGESKAESSPHDWQTPPRMKIAVSKD